MSTAALTQSTVLPVTSATKLFRLQTLNMTPSSTGDSPRSATGNAGRPFTMPSRDTFTVEVPSPQLSAVTNGNPIKSPISLKTQRTPSFSREGILGSAQKARNLSQSSENRPDGVPNGVHKAPSVGEESSNPLKRRNTDAGVDYPRRRATIAVRKRHGRDMNLV